MSKSLKIILVTIILIALIIVILSMYLFKNSIEYNNTENTINTNANVADELYINSNNSTILNPNISNQTVTTTNETVSSKQENANSIISKNKTETKVEKHIDTNDQTSKTNIQNNTNTNKNTNNSTSNIKTNNANDNNKTTSTETKPKQDIPNTTVKTENNDTSHLANKTYRKTNNDIIPEIINILNNEISKDAELVEYGSKALKGTKQDAYKNTSCFTYMFVKDISKGKVSGNYTVFEQRVRNNVGAFGKYFVYAEDEYTYDSSGKNPRWSQTLVWIWVTF